MILLRSPHVWHIDGLVQERHNPSVLTMELCLLHLLTEMEVMLSWGAYNKRFISHLFMHAFLSLTKFREFLFNDHWWEKYFVIRLFFTTVAVVLSVVRCIYISYKNCHWLIRWLCRIMKESKPGVSDCDGICCIVWAISLYVCNITFWLNNLSCNEIILWL